MAQILIERGFSSFTIPFVETAFFTGDYFAEVTQHPLFRYLYPSPRFNVPDGDEEFFKSLMDLYRYNAPSPSSVPFMHADWWKEVTDWGDLSAQKAERTFSRMKQSHLYTVMKRFFDCEKSKFCHIFFFVLFITNSCE